MFFGLVGSHFSDFEMHDYIFETFFLMEELNAMNFPFNITFGLVHRFWDTVFSFSFIVINCV